jgi:molybdopterin-guanine dinucleotide biosynthesis protein A
VAHRGLTGILLVGGASRRFGSPKALARSGEETLAERGWRVLGEVCDERIAVGKAGELELPFPLLDDGSDVRAPIAGVIAGLRAATNDVTVVLPVDCFRVPPELVAALGSACRDAAVTQEGPLPGAWAKSALPLLEKALIAGDYSLKATYVLLDVAKLDVDSALLADADTPEELARWSAREAPAP